MVTFKRLLLWFSLVIGVLGFLALAGELAEKERLIFGAVLLLLIIFFMDLPFLLRIIRRFLVGSAAALRMAILMIFFVIF